MHLGLIVDPMHLKISKRLALKKVFLRISNMGCYRIVFPLYFFTNGILPYHLISQLVRVRTLDMLRQCNKQLINLLYKKDYIQWIILRITNPKMPPINIFNIRILNAVAKRIESQYFFMVRKVLSSPVELLMEKPLELACPPGIHLYCHSLEGIISFTLLLHEGAHPVHAFE